MDDIDIRTYIGQENPESDDPNAKKSTFEYMRDQSKSYGYYATKGNREYTVHKKFTSRWRFRFVFPSSVFFLVKTSRT